ncbi:hypothetical protein BV25DRAFT_1918714 [Artomyces pyxidatus]|uniref:Uncharacterized protein n=1 Tax=Artomyces pyxidatus TaxID=48021 RepID=A0ACB8STS1_9AGAM|nr:hypothetical protein BV25DRAFT_1918714 [Artomyces pyxidatus]
MSLPDPAEDLIARPRILRRGWSLRKPHLLKSTSLPVLALVPAGRPLFTCLACGFANIYVPVCLWCRWSSAEATADFHVALTHATRRRISSPQLTPIGCARTSPAAPLDPRIDARRDRRSTLARSSLPEIPPHFRSPAGPSDTARATVPTTTSLSSSPRHPPKATQTRVKPARPLRDKRGLPPLSILPSAHLPFMPSPSILTSSMRPSTATSIPDQASLLTPSQTHNSLPPLLSSSTRTLRRKTRMPILRKKSSRSLRSRASTSALPTSNPVLPANSLFPSPSSPVRLGHPSRPYYTAIRTNMQQRAPLPSPPVHAVAPAPLPPFSGSLSGEMELHMALAARRSEEGRTEGYSFLFEEPGSRRAGRVRKLGSGLWGFLVGK